MNKTLPIFLLFIILLISGQIEIAVAQINAGNLSSINVNDLSDVQVKELVDKAHASGQTDEQLIELARSRGMQAAQIDALRARIGRLKIGTDTTAQQTKRAVNTQYNANDIDTAKLVISGPKIFGADLFNGRASTFEPNLRLATPVNYVLGPEDQLNISVYGNSLDDWKVNVSPEGNINIPHVGIISVGGKTIEQATTLIRSRLTASNFAIGKGSFLKVTLGDIRSIKVILTGEVNKPGTYTLPSLATVFNALYAAGGPNSDGSLRKIEILRNNEVIRTLDVYDFLLKGSQKDNIGLKDQDIIRIPNYQVRVEMSGEVKRPALYEVLENESLQDVLKFSGGFTDMAAAKKIQVYQIAGDERNIVDIPESGYKTYIPSRGDRFIVGRILERFRNRISIAGAVIRPGVYALENGLTVGGLITKASGLREDAFTPRGTVTRLNADNTTQTISFNVRDIINNSTSDIPLKREDLVTISSIFDFRDLYTVSVNGEVRRPGNFEFSDSLTVENLILKAGGLTEGAARKRIEVSRRTDNSDPNSLNGTIAQVFTITVDNELGLKSTNFVLRPFDRVSVYTSPGYEKQRTVKVEGEVFYPGYYTIRTKNERVSDLITEAGGITPSAYIEGGTLKRDNSSILGFDKDKVDTNALSRERKSRIQRINNSMSDSSANMNDQLRNNFVGIELRKVIEKPGSKNDLVLQDGDILRIPKQQETVRVNGEVLVPSSIVYSSGKSFRSYVSNAGGFSDDARRRESYVIYPNGTVKGTGKFLFFNVFPEVKPGSEIFVPKKKPRIGNFGQTAVTITSIAGTLALVILGIISLHK